jgi:ribosomal protein L12E/L44/L45/RPP1/RPP2
MHKILLAAAFLALIFNAQAASHAGGAPAKAASAPAKAASKAKASAKKEMKKEEAKK